MRYRQIAFEDIFPKLIGVCSYCQHILTGKRTRWCSKECSNSAWEYVNVIRGSSKYIRTYLKKRDGEICGKCGVDCAKLKRIFDHADRSLQTTASKEWKRSALNPQFMALRHFGFKPGAHTWEADHITSVADGGDNHPDNLMTLCLLCHKEKTKQWKSKKSA